MTGLEIIGIMDAAAKLLDLINTAAEKARERGEWTPEEEAAFESKKAGIMAKAYWQPKK